MEGTGERGNGKHSADLPAKQSRESVSKIIAERLSRALTERGILDPANEGFLLQKGCQNAISTIVDCYEDAKQYGKSIYSLFYDVSGAYDRIGHEQIKRGMEILHLPDKLKNYVMNKMKGATYSARTEYGMTEEFEVKRGVPQGDPLSPIVYIIAMNPLHVGMRRNPLHGYKEDGYEMKEKEGQSLVKVASKGYADDTCALSGTEDGIRRLGEWVAEYCRVNRLSMNWKKCQFFGRNEEGRDWADIEKEKKENAKGINIVKVLETGKEEIPEGTKISRRGEVRFAETLVKQIAGDSKKIKYLGSG